VRVRLVVVVVDAGDEMLRCCNHVCLHHISITAPSSSTGMSQAGVRVRVKGVLCDVAFLLGHAATWWVAALLRGEAYIVVPLHRDRAVVNP
jgi:hypothetical protein